MIEVIVPGVLALVSGGFIWMAKNDKRIRDLDRRIDQVELRMAEEYVSKTSFQHAVMRIENQLIRMEDKIDTVMQIAANK